MREAQAEGRIRKIRWLETATPGKISLAPGLATAFASLCALRLR
jgi:hypothetical protein